MCLLRQCALSSCLHVDLDAPQRYQSLARDRVVHLGQDARLRICAVLLEFMSL